LTRLSLEPSLLSLPRAPRKSRIRGIRTRTRATRGVRGVRPMSPVNRLALHEAVPESQRERASRFSSVWDHTAVSP
jgi:hypothetical protein